MTLNVRERADTIGTLRHISVFAMETLARWVPTTPELEAKIVLGRHIWEFAQHADGLGRRTHELRAAMHYSPAPTDPYVAILEEWRALTATADRIGTLYDAIIPDLDARYAAYLAATDVFLDEPSVRIVERNRADLPRMIEESRALRKERPELAASPAAAAMARRLAACTEYVSFRAPVGSTAERLA
ncbi:MAG: hypothetical protein KJZ74_14885 [Gemmatimonadales bacterium]|nr:hypothetical protein [Gemmatimonadota bacterium]MCL4215188.1 hypothetical protein [Gemmatimonadales bacterium]